MVKLTKSLALIGFQASGKTTLGQKLSDHLRCTFVDTDQLIEQFHPSMSCREIFQHFGSSYFRQLETQVITSLKYQTPLIVATGGGCLLQSNNGIMLKAHNRLIYLKTSEEILKKRFLERATFPSYLIGDDPDHAFRHLFKERSVMYEKWADHVMEMDGLNQEDALKVLLQFIE
jgi:shikimate kinase